MAERMHDLGPGRRGRGNDFVIRKVHDEGQRLSLATWTTPVPKTGDYLALENKGGRTRYLVREVKLCMDPPDMAFVEADFAPVGATGNDDGGDDGSDVRQ